MLSFNESGCKKQGWGSVTQSHDNLINTRPQSTINCWGYSNNKNFVIIIYNQSNFSIVTLILKRVKVYKLELKDMLKQHFKEVNIYDIQISRLRIFTIFTSDFYSFNKRYNGFRCLWIYWYLKQQLNYSEIFVVIIRQSWM